MIDGKIEQQQQLLERKTILQSYLLCSNFYLALQEYHSRSHLRAVHDMRKAVVAKGVVGINGHVTCKMPPGQSKPQRTSAQLLDSPLFPIQNPFSFSALLKSMSPQICLSDLCLLQRCPHVWGRDDSNRSLYFGFAGACSSPTHPRNRD